MTLLWITVFLLHQGYALDPVVTVQLGEPVTFTCEIMGKFQSTTWLQWYKQRAGDTLKLIVMQRKNVDPSYGPVFDASHYIVTNDGKTSNLTVLNTVHHDEGMYYCALIDWTESTWTGTYLMIKGNSERTLSYTTLDSETLHCSLLAESWNNSCLEDSSVFWFRAGSSRSYPNIMYIDGKRADKCEKSSNSQRKCRFNFPDNISSSEPGTYYCAVATCGEVLFGNEIRKGGDKSPKIGILLITAICLAISVIVNITLICKQLFACKAFKENPSEEENSNLGTQRDETPEEGQDLNYSTLRFSGEKMQSGKKKKELKNEIVYSQVKRSV